MGSMKYSKQLLSSYIFYILAPILYFTSTDGTSSYYCFLLIDFTDSYSTYIIVIFFVITFLIAKNNVLRVFTRINNSLSRTTTPSSNINNKNNLTYNTLSSTLRFLSRTISFIQ